MRPIIAATARVSMIVPVHNGGAPFVRCLRHLAAANPPPDELIVVADGVTDGSDDVAQRSGAAVVRNARPQGAAAARNRGAAAATGDIYFFVDADVALPPDAVARIRQAFARDPDIAAVFGSYDDRPGAANFLSQYRNLLHHYHHQQATVEAGTFWSGCGAVRREAFAAVGGFDAKVRGIEDIELGYRLRRAGFCIRVLKSLQVTHLKHWTVASMLWTDVFMRALPWTDLILSGEGFSDDLNIRVRARVSVVAAWLLGLAALAAIGWPRLAAAAPVLLAALILLNSDLYLFFLRHRGIAFTAKAFFWHWIYHLYCGLAFAIGLGRHLWRRLGSPRPKRRRP